jgi:AcrR family transcriptional regulator
MKMKDCAKVRVRNTKERILDAGERLFALQGYGNTSLRALTAEAGVNLAAVNYHFGSKEALLRAIFERRLNPMNRIRIERMEEVARQAEEAGRAPRPGDVLGAFISPVFRNRESGNGMKDFSTLVGRTLAEPDPSGRDLFTGYMRPVLSRCLELLCAGLPTLSKEVVFWRLMLIVGAMGHIMRLPKDFPLLPEGVAVPEDAEGFLSLLMPFVTAGMEAPNR